MTPDELNALVATIEKALTGQPGISTVSTGVPADAEGTLPELYCEVNGEDVCLTVSPLDMCLTGSPL